ncbi:hypothetical protein RFI_09232, partial [Reticulomyxa filosa]
NNNNNNNNNSNNNNNTDDTVNNNSNNDNHSNNNNNSNDENSNNRKMTNPQLLIKLLLASRSFREEPGSTTHYRYSESEDCSPLSNGDEHDDKDQYPYSPTSILLRRPREMTIDITTPQLQQRGQSTVSASEDEDDDNNDDAASLTRENNDNSNDNDEEEEHSKVPKSRKKAKAKLRVKLLRMELPPTIEQKASSTIYSKSINERYSGQNRDKHSDQDKDEEDQSPPQFRSGEKREYHNRRQSQHLALAIDDCQSNSSEILHAATGSTTKWVESNTPPKSSTTHYLGVHLQAGQPVTIANNTVTTAVTTAVIAAADQPNQLCKGAINEYIGDGSRTRNSSDNTPSVSATPTVLQKNTVATNRDNEVTVERGRNNSIDVGGIEYGHMPSTTRERLLTLDPRESDEEKKKEDVD